MSLTNSVCRRRRHERGAVAIIVALTVSALLIAGAVVLDFGLVRYDRQNNKSAADSAVAAGLQAADNGDGEVYNSQAVCEAYQFLKSNRRALAGLPADVCATPSSTQTCTPGDPTTNVSYHGTTTSGTTRFEVWIKMPYSVSDNSTGGPFTQESKATLAADTGDTAKQGCDQLGVVVKEWTKPGLGKIVHSGELATRIRSVARVKVQNGDLAPALLLLERHKCGVLTVGSAGSPSRIKVYGTGTTPATIHADSDATDSGCGSGPNQQLLQGKQADGVAAYGGTDGSSGTITTVATAMGRAANIVLDAAANVYGTTALNESSPGTRSAVTGRRAIGRKLIDKRYFPGVKGAAAAAYAEWTKSHSSAPGYGHRYGCPNAADMTAMAAMTEVDSVYIDCPGNSGIGLNGTINAGTIYFHGFIKNGNLKMPLARKVYVDDTDDSGARISAQAINLTAAGSGFCVRSSACVSLSAGTCSNAPTLSTTANATLMVRRGSLDASGGLVRLCNTRVILEGGELGGGTLTNPGACIPASIGALPTSTPCTSASTTSGNGQVSLGGTSDWTAPNAFGDLAAAGYVTDAQKHLLWDAGEDLALWTETYGTSSTYKMAGGGNLHVGGVFMTPNAAPFNVTGNGAQDLTNAQFIATSFAVDGGAVLTMRVDPNNAVGLPSLYDFRLVR